MSENYKFTSETMEWEGHTLHRIEALRDFSTTGGIRVHAGDKGGWIEEENNLSKGDAYHAWVADEAKVYNGAKVTGDSLVTDNSIIAGKVEIYDGAISDSTVINIPDDLRFEVSFGSMLNCSIMNRQDIIDVGGNVINWCSLENNTNSRLDEEEKVVEAILVTISDTNNPAGWKENEISEFVIVAERREAYEEIAKALAKLDPTSYKDGLYVRAVNQNNQIEAYQVVPTKDNGKDSFFIRHMKPDKDDRSGLRRESFGSGWRELSQSYSPRHDQQIHMAYLDEKNENNKFYVLSYDAYEKQCHAEYGSLPTEKGQTAQKSGETDFNKTKMFWVKYAEKIAKGYVEVDKDTLERLKANEVSDKELAELRSRSAFRETVSLPKSPVSHTAYTLHNSNGEKFNVSQNVQYPIEDLVRWKIYYEAYEAKYNEKHYNEFFSEKIAKAHRRCDDMNVPEWVIDMAMTYYKNFDLENIKRDRLREIEWDSFFKQDTPAWKQYVKHVNSELTKEPVKEPVSSELTQWQEAWQKAWQEQISASKPSKSDVIEDNYYASAISSKRPFIACDVETTGAAENDMITQIALAAYVYNKDSDRYELQDHIFMLAKADTEALAQIKAASSTNGLSMENTLAKQGIDKDEWVKSGIGLTSTEMQVGVTSFLEKYQVEETAFILAPSGAGASYFMDKDGITLASPKNPIDADACYDFSERPDRFSQYAMEHRELTGEKIVHFDALTVAMMAAEIACSDTGIDIAHTSVEYLSECVKEEAYRHDYDDDDYGYDDYYDDEDYEDYHHSESHNYVMSLAKASEYKWNPDSVSVIRMDNNEFDSLVSVSVGREIRYVDVDSMFEVNDNFEVTLAGEKEPIKNWEELEAKIKALNSDITEELLDAIKEKYEAKEKDSVFQQLDSFGLDIPSEEQQAEMSLEEVRVWKDHVVEQAIAAHAEGDEPSPILEAMFGSTIPVTEPVTEPTKMESAQMSYEAMFAQMNDDLNVIRNAQARYDRDTTATQEYVKKQIDEIYELYNEAVRTLAFVHAQGHACNHNDYYYARNAIDRNLTSSTVLVSKLKEYLVGTTDYEINFKHFRYDKFENYTHENFKNIKYDLAQAISKTAKEYAGKANEKANQAEKKKIKTMGEHDDR